MPTIIPRWEWRTFGARFGSAEAAFAALTPGAVQESDELYLLSGAGDNVKVRDDLMDIKVLQEVNDDGLQRWTPVMKAAFPLAAPDVARVFEALRLPTPALGRDGYTLDQFVTELAGPSALRAVHVHKRRVRYTVGGCTSEVSDVVADGRATRTIAIESEDAAAVIAAVRSVGLGDYLNTDYPRGLAALLDGIPERYAVIDVGTNSIKFHVAERAHGGWRTVIDRAELTRLGEGLEEHGIIAPEALDRTAAAIAGMVDEAKRHDARAIAAVGTAGLRIARDSAEAIAAIASRTGVTVEVIPGQEEGRLAYLAVKSGLGLARGSLVVFDTGGGSTQFTFGRDADVAERFSVDVGAVRYTERFGLDRAVSAEVLGEALAAIAVDLSRIDGRPTPDVLVGMGGAITNLTAVKHALATYDPDVVQGSTLERAEVDRQVERYRSMDAAGRRSIVGLQPKRAEVILAGACIVRTVMDKLGKDALTVSDRGLRHGVLAERFGS
jgi:exopolyphosphatase/guanosine-5'-triphosphate,3'-diphosphate pyrophosphatase